MKADTLISVIVSTYNRPDALELVLAACLAQTDRHFEIVIADDGSGPATREVVERTARLSPIPIAHAWQPDEGFRAAASRNGAIALARGEYLIFLDGDCVPQRDFVARHRALAQPRTVVTGSRILLRQRLTALTLEKRLSLAEQPALFWLRQRLAGQVNKVVPLMLKLPDFAKRGVKGFVWRGIKTCNLGAWRGDVVAVNGFDESFVGWGHEDADLVARLHNAGVGRKNGFWATEVLHLWHEEAARDREGPNYNRVLARLADGTTRAQKGLTDRAAVTYAARPFVDTAIRPSCNDIAGFDIKHHRSTDLQHVSIANPPSYRLTAARTFAVAALCCVPISTALTNITCGLFALALLSAPEFWRKLPAMLRHGAVWSTLLLLAALVASISYSSAGTHEAWSWFGKYYKLLLLPFGVIAFADSRTDWDVVARWGLFVTLCVVLLLSTTNYLGLTSLGPAHVAADPSTRAYVFKNRIAAGLAGALLFYQAADFALIARSWRSRIVFAAIALLSLINVLVMLQGRTGQAIAVLFMLVVAVRLAWQMRGGSPWRLILCSFAVLAAIAVLVTVAFTARGSRIGEVASEVQAYRQSDATTSAGLRLEWYRKSLDLIRARPLTGYGVGGLGAEFAQLTKGETGAEGAMTLNPHNEYLLMAVQLGLPGIVLLVNLIVQVARYGVRLEPRSRHLLLAWLATFAIGSLANSLLLDFTEGHLFALLSGILLGCGYRSAGAARAGVSSPG